VVAASCLLNEKVQRLRPFWKIVVVLQTQVMMMGLALHGVVFTYLTTTRRRLSMATKRATRHYAALRGHFPRRSSNFLSYLNLILLRCAGYSDLQPECPLTLASKLSSGILALLFEMCALLCKSRHMYIIKTRRKLNECDSPNRPLLWSLGRGEI
jgi:hypothetical protein